MKKKIIIGLGILIMIGSLLFLLYRMNIIPHSKYTDQDFSIATYKSKNDQDQDGMDDQTDFLEGVKAYLATHPKYQSKYYASGYPDDEYGVCTDVVAFGLLAAGYNLQTLVDTDIRENRNLYDIDKVDKNIDFRRVRNLLIYFERNSISLTLDLSKIEEWQQGDIVVFKNHIGVLSEHRNRKGIPFVYHHASPYQQNYEEDILPYHDDIMGHFRMS